MAERDAIRLVGVHLGRSPSPARWRLYLTPNFTRYLEFRKADTLRSERLSSGKVAAWVKGGGQIREATAAAARPADFLAGGLLDHLGRANEADTLRRLLGLSLQRCDGDGDKQKPKEPKTIAGELSCPDPQSCSTPGRCQI